MRFTEWLGLKQIFLCQILTERQQPNQSSSWYPGNFSNPGFSFLNVFSLKKKIFKKIFELSLWQLRFSLKNEGERPPTWELLLTERSVQDVLKCWHYISCAVFYFFYFVHFPFSYVYSLTNELLMECQRLLTALNPHFACLLFVQHSSFVGWSASYWVAHKILGICRQNERRIKEWLLNTPRQKSGLLFSHSKHSPSSAASLL